MKPFNIEEAKKGKPVCTRDGHSVRIITIDDNKKYPITAELELDDRKVEELYMANGRTTPL